VQIDVDQAVCQRYGHCCSEAPTVFELDDAGEELHWPPHVDASLAAEVEAAARACPVQAIVTRAG
jgi:ferredoxin